MEWIIVNLKITFVLLGWILATYGFGLAFFALLVKFYNTLIVPSTYSNAISNPPLRKTYIHYHKNLPFGLAIPIIGLLGVICVSVLVGWIHIFMPISPIISIMGLVLGVCFVFFFMTRGLFKDMCNKTYIFAFIIAFLFVMWAGCLSESAYDTGLYHIQATKWVQESPLIFGLANIHTRFGFNNILYNFSAISEASHIVGIRSFITNEIMTFFTLMGSLMVCFSLRFDSIYRCFVALGCVWLLAVFPNLQGLYAEGYLGLVGFCIVAYLIYILESSPSHTQDSLFAFFLLFILAFFSVYIKISAIMLIPCVLVLFFQYFKLSKHSFKILVFLLIVPFLLGIIWGIKGICLSGAVAYPAGLFYFESLPWAVDNITRVGEVATIHNWAKVGGASNPKELLESGKWVGYWFSQYIMPLSYRIGLILSIIAICIGAVLAFTKKSVFRIYIPLLVCLFLGILFWFFSAPDPRFGWQYFVPFFGILLAMGLYHISHKIVLKSQNALFYCALLGIGAVYALGSNNEPFNLKTISGFKDTSKIPSIPLQKYTNHNNLSLFIPFEGEDRVYDAPLPASTSQRPNLAKGTFLGRDMYYIQPPHTKQKAQDSSSSQSKDKE